jgi:hypothetical protein
VRGLGELRSREHRDDGLGIESHPMQ